MTEFGPMGCAQVHQEGRGKHKSIYHLHICTSTWNSKCAVGSRVSQNSMGPCAWTSNREDGGGIYFVVVVHLKERVLVDIFRRGMRRMKEE